VVRGQLELVGAFPLTPEFGAVLVAVLGQQVLAEISVFRVPVP